MNWDRIEANLGAVVELAAKLNGTPVSPAIADAVRDAVTALKADKIKEFGGLEAVAAKAIAQFDSGADRAPESEPSEAPKPKRGKS